MKSTTLLALGLTILAASCVAPVSQTHEEAQANEPQSAATTKPALPEVHIWGSLPGMHKRGEVDALVTLAELMPSEDLIALGAAADLDGEITIHRGMAHITRPRNGEAKEIRTQLANDAGACMMVAAHVPEWSTIQIMQDIPMSEFDAWMTAHLDTTGPIPFTIYGRFSQLDWHIVDGSKATSGDSSCASHSAQGIQFQLAPEEIHVTLVGFWSKHHKAVFSRHDSENHTHVIAHGQSGHVDDAVIPAGATLSIPAGVTFR